jgi:hypothetical protein
MDTQLLWLITPHIVYPSSQCLSTSDMYSHRAKTVPKYAKGGTQGSRGIAPVILNFGTRRRYEVNFMSQLLYAHKRRPCTHWIWGLTWTLWWREKSHALARNQTHPLHYPSFHHGSKTTITYRYPLLNMNTYHIPLFSLAEYESQVLITRMDFLHKYFIYL